MERRLVKIAKELNVGLSTIVDFLQDKGHDIDPKPTAKVSEAMYQELLQEFQRSMSIKEQADQLVIGTRPSSPAKKEEPAAKEERPSVLGKSAEVPGSSILKSRLATPPAPKAATPEPEPQPEPVKEEPAEPEAAKEEQPAESTGPKLKVLGKIDLDAPRKKGGKKEEKEEPAAKQEEEVKEAEPAPVAEKEPEAPAPEPEPEAVAPAPDSRTRSEGRRNSCT